MKEKRQSRRNAANPCENSPAPAALKLDYLKGVSYAATINEKKSMRKLACWRFDEDRIPGNCAKLYPGQTPLRAHLANLSRLKKNKGSLSED